MKLVPHFQSNLYQHDYAISNVCQLGTKLSTTECQVGTTLMDSKSFLYHGDFKSMSTWYHMGTTLSTCSKSTWYHTSYFTCKQCVVLQYVDLVPLFQSNNYQDDYAISSVCQFGTTHMYINSISTVYVCQLGTTSSYYS